MGADDAQASNGGAPSSSGEEAAQCSRASMTRRSLLVRAGAAGIILGATPIAFAMPGPRPGSEDQPQGGPDPLERNFRAPPESSRAGVYWWWLEGAASKAGITADLEAMQQQGIGCAQGAALHERGVAQQLSFCGA
jgi:hypothetical protein